MINDIKPAKKKVELSMILTDIGIIIYLIKMHYSNYMPL